MTTGGRSFERSLPKIDFCAGINGDTDADELREGERDRIDVVLSKLRARSGRHVRTSFGG